LNHVSHVYALIFCPLRLRKLAQFDWLSRKNKAVHLKRTSAEILHPEIPLMDTRKPPVFVSLTRKRTTFCCDQHTGNRVVAKIIPVLLVGAAGFAAWVYTAQICGMALQHLAARNANVQVNFLIKKHHNNVLGCMVFVQSIF
jgi:hypothetical protein